MTTFYDQSQRTTIDLRDRRAGKVDCQTQVSDENEKEIIHVYSRTRCEITDREMTSGLTVSTQKDRISVPLDINWSIQRAKNLRANKVRVSVDTSYKGSVLPLAKCGHEIK